MQMSPVKQRLLNDYWRNELDNANKNLMKELGISV
jgi:hypothetical protein